jgi:NADH-quinone oxidoreductase subunit N
MTYNLLLTEILLAIAGVVILALGLMLPKHGKAVSGPIAILAIIGILAYTATHFLSHQVFFNGVYQVDIYGNFFKLLFLTAALLVMLNSSKYIDQSFGEKSNEYYSLLMFATLGMIIMANAGDFITIYLGLELMTITFYILTAYLLNDERSSEAGLKYLILGSISSAVLLFGVSLVFACTGTTVISEVAAKMTSTQPALIAGIVMIIAGFAFKISIVPFHMWAPDIYQGAPIPTSTFLAVGSKAAGFAALVRVFLVAFPAAHFNWNLTLGVLAGITIIVGNLIALNQTNVKRLLAYSSIAQAGYILVGLVASNNYGLKGVLFYSMVYVFANTGAFAVATSVEADSGSTDMQAFNGLSKRSPFMASVMTVCTLSLAGIPPMAGFAGKFYLFSGAIQSGYLWLAFVGLLMSMISVYYYLGIAKAMFIGEGGSTEPVNMGGSARLAMWICLLGTLFCGVCPQPLSQLAQYAVQIFM